MTTMMELAMDAENRVRSRFAAQFSGGLKNVKFFLDPTAGRGSTAELHQEIEAIEEAIAAGRTMPVAHIDGDIQRKPFDSPF